VCSSDLCLSCASDAVPDLALLAGESEDRAPLGPFGEELPGDEARRDVLSRRPSTRDTGEKQGLTPGELGGDSDSAAAEPLNRKRGAWRLMNGAAGDEVGQ